MQDKYKIRFLLILATPVAAALAQTAAAPPNLARQAIENRKAVFTLIGTNFRPIGEVLRGTAPYNAGDVTKYASRVSFLASLLPDAFPDVSKQGDTETKPDVWSNRADFDKRLKDFGAHAAALSQLTSQSGGDTDGFKAAARAVAQDCKSCHDAYRAR